MIRFATKKDMQALHDKGWKIPESYCAGGYAEQGYVKGNEVKFWFADAWKHEFGDYPMESDQCPAT